MLLKRWFLVKLVISVEKSQILFRPEIQWKIETGFAFLILEVFRSKGCLVRCGIQDNTMSCSNQHRQRGLHIRNIIFGSSYITIYKLRVVLTRIKNIHFSRITPLSRANVHFINKKWISSVKFESKSKYPLFWWIVISEKSGYFWGKWKYFWEKWIFLRDLDIFKFGLDQFLSKNTILTHFQNLTFTGGTNSVNFKTVIFIKNGIFWNFFLKNNFFTIFW